MKMRLKMARKRRKINTKRKRHLGKNKRSWRVKKNPIQPVGV